MITCERCGNECVIYAYQTSYSIDNIAWCNKCGGFWKYGRNKSTGGECEKGWSFPEMNLGSEKPSHNKAMFQLLCEMDTYLAGHKENSICTGSVFHQQINDAVLAQQKQQLERCAKL